MTIVYKDTYTVYFVKSDTKKTASTLEEAHKMARGYVGNSVYNRPWATEEIFFYGPGNGDTTCMIRRDVEFK